MAATSLADSTAAFEKQASNLGLEDEWIQGLKRLGIKNLGGLAFACGQPGSPVPEADVRALLDQAVNGKAVTVGDVVVMKRLIFEAQTSMVALSRAHADPAADPSTRKMPTAERATRLAAQKLRLTGLDLQGTLEVAHSVYDVINGMVEADTYVSGQMHYQDAGDHICKAPQRIEARLKWKRHPGQRRAE